MDNDLILELPSETTNIAKAKTFCAQFCNDKSKPHYVLGLNVYAKSILEHVHLDGFIDDFSQEDHYLGLPLLKSHQIPKNALVLFTSGGRPLTVRAKLKELGVVFLDYFAFYRWSGLALPDIVFNQGFYEDFVLNKSKYEWVDSLLGDEISRRIYRQLVNFRLKLDIDFLEGFEAKEDKQYFEDFLNLAISGETFIDIGGFDGYTTQQFIKHCPHYKAVHIFEPDPNNLKKCSISLAEKSNIYIHQLGLSDTTSNMRLNSMGSASQVSAQGMVQVKVARLDDILKDAPTFIKMDIEGAELGALEGAKKTIIDHHPRLAIAIYHYADGAGPFWQIAEKVLSFRQDYDVYIRHYTESLYETIMFFMPKAIG